MTKTIIGLVILVSIALVGYRKTFVRLPLPSGARFFFLTGTEFIFIGLALGDQFMGLLDHATIARLGPLFSLGLGYFGLVFGLQFEKEKVSRFPRAFFSAALIQATVTFLLVFVPFIWLLHQMRFDMPAVALAMAIGAVACCTSPTIIALIVNEGGHRTNSNVDLIRYIAGFDPLLGFTFFGLAACALYAAPSPLGIDFLPFLQWIGVSIVFGISMGFLLHLLIQVHCAEDELWVFIIGIITFTGGVAIFFSLSPLFVNMIAGVTAANLPGSKDRVFMAVARQEKPFYIVFLILAGAVWQPAAGISIALAAAYLFFRTCGKILGGYAAARFIAKDVKAPPWFGLVFLSQSGVAIAMAMDLYLAGSSPLMNQVVGMLVIAVIINELISPEITRKLLTRTWGEVG
ncbi:MAG: hypothetical protein U5L07_13030 [Desulfobacterales bacterium]|nr:hypothetical protein [Desulfobacterales bacterium]